MTTKTIYGSSIRNYAYQQFQVMGSDLMTKKNVINKETKSETEQEKKVKKYEPKTDQFRFLRPDDSHKTFRFQQWPVSIKKWITIQTDEIKAFNSMFLKGTLSLADAENRALAIKEAWYNERDKDSVIPLLMSGNAKILQEFLADRYTEAKLKRMAPNSYNTEVWYLQKALLALGNIAVEGPIEPIQNAIDNAFDKDPMKHKRRAGSINRIRKYLSLKYIEHLRAEQIEVTYLRREQVEKLIAETEGAYQVLIAVAFYTGLRRSEIFGLERDDLRGDILNVNRQKHRDGTVRLPKNRKKRKAFVIPGGQKWLNKWFDIMDEVGRHIAVSKICQMKANVRFHDLRHSNAVYMISRGATIDWVAKHLGHSRETCERCYTSHVLDTDSTLLLRGLFQVDAQKTKADHTTGASVSQAIA